MFYLTRAVVSTSIALATASAIGQEIPAHFWLSTSASHPNPGEIPTISIGTDIQGKLYIWGRPRKLTASDGFDRLENLSLNIITEVVDGPPVIDFLDDQIDVFNEELPFRRFEFDRDSTPQDCDPSAAEFICVPAMGSDVSPDPNGDLLSADSISNMAGFSFDSAMGGSIGGTDCEQTDYCFLSSDGEPAWLLASVGYRAVSDGEMNVFLQVGKLGMNHVGESSSSTFVRFGAITDPAHNAATEQGLPQGSGGSDTIDASIAVSRTGDYNGDTVTDYLDYTFWKSNFGMGMDLPGSNGNGRVDAADYVLWRLNLGSEMSGSGSPSIVPEPSNWLILLAAASALLWSRRLRLLCLRRWTRPFRQLDYSGVIAQRGVGKASSRSAHIRNVCRTPPISLRLIVGVIVGLLCESAYATDFDWVGSMNDTSGPWSVDTFWDPVGVPNSASDTATISVNPGSNYVILVNIDPTLAGLTLNDVNAALNASGRTFSVENGTLDLLNGALLGVPTFSLSGGVAVALGDGSSLTGGATFEFGGSSTVGTLSVADDRLAGGRSLVIDGTTTGADLTIQSADFLNFGDITLQSLGNHAMLNIDNAGMSGVLTNVGTINANAPMGSDWRNTLNLTLNNTPLGEVNINENTVLGDGSGSGEAHVNNGQITVAEDAFLRIYGDSFTQAGGSLMVNGLLTSGDPFVPPTTYTQTGGVWQFGPSGSFSLTRGSLDLQTGSLIGDPTFDLTTVSTVTLGSATDYVGDVTFRVLPSSLTVTNFFVADDRLVSGRSLVLQGSAGAEAAARINAAEFTNLGRITLEGAHSSVLDVNDNGAVGRLTNVGVIEADNTGDNQLTLELNNTLFGMVSINGPTHLGTTSGTGLEDHVNGGKIDVASGNTLEIYGNSFTNALGGVLRGAGTIDVSNLTSGRLDNFGRIAPGFSPDIITVQGDYSQGATGVLNIEIGGLTAGSEHDQLVVTGAATLDGRLGLSMLNDFNPAVNDVVTVLTAASVSGQFDKVFVANPPAFRAVKLIYDSTSAKVRFVAPVLLDYDPISGGGIWSNPGIWLGGVVPDSENQATLMNTTAGDQLVTVDANFIVNDVSISGTSNEMRLVVPSGNNLSAVQSVAIGNHGTLQLDGGSLLSSNISVDSDGRLDGVGQIVGNVVNSGVISPGSSPGDLSIDGDYTQASTGTLAIEVDGVNPGEYDTVGVTGSAALSGTLLIDASELTAISPGTTLMLLSADDLMGSEFDSVQTSGSDEVYFVASYTDGGAGATAALLGDMNHDDVLNNVDLSYFALALVDPDAYIVQCGNAASDAFFCDSGVGPGDLDGLIEGSERLGNGKLNFDDIDDFAYLMGLSTSAVAAAIRDLSRVPEPSSALLILSGSLLASTASCVRRRATSIAPIQLRT